MRPARLALLALAIAAAPLVPARALAQQQDAAIAEQLFRDGRALLEAGKVDEACDKFVTSQRIAPAIGTLLNLAICRERQGKTATAWSLFADVEAQAQRAGDQARLQIAHDHEAALGGRLRKIVIDLPAPPPGTVVKLDGEALPTGALGTEIPVDPGHHDIAVSAPGKEPWEEPKLDADAGSSPVHVRVDLRDALATTVTETPTPASPPTTEAHRILWPAWVAFGVGAAGLLTGGIAGGLALSDASDAKSHCQGNVCTPAGQSPADSAKHLATVSDVGFVVGAAGGLAGAALWIWAPTERRESSVGVLLGPMSVTIHGSFR
ncbi:MAG TPA: hypothetical protein VF765_11490 [Polyangiaceae bacterium]